MPTVKNPMTDRPVVERREAAPSSRAAGAARALRWLVVTAGILLIILLLGIVAVVVLAIPIDLSPVRGRIEAAVTAAVQRPFRIEGPLILLPTLPPGAAAGQGVCYRSVSSA